MSAEATNSHGPPVAVQNPYSLQDFDSVLTEIDQVCTICKCPFTLAMLLNGDPFKTIKEVSAICPFRALIFNELLAGKPLLKHVFQLFGDIIMLSAIEFDSGKSDF